MHERVKYLTFMADVYTSVGGKRPAGSFKDYDMNPCFCKGTAARCYDSQTKTLITGTCPTDGTAYCMKDASNSMEVRPKYVGFMHISIYLGCL